MDEYVTYFGELDEGDIFFDNDEPENFYICLGGAGEELTDSNCDFVNAYDIHNRILTRFDCRTNVTRVNNAVLKVTFKK